jgi:hypothetical protein
VGSESSIFKKIRGTVFIIFISVMVSSFICGNVKELKNLKGFMLNVEEQDS